MMPMPPRIWIAVAVLSGTACGGPEVGSVDPSPAPLHEDYLVYGDPGDRPPGCDLETVAARLAELFTAINEGEAAIGERFFVNQSDDSLPGSFRWFSFGHNDRGGEGQFLAHSPDSLDAYFAERHAAGDELVLRGVMIQGSGARGTVGLGPIMFQYSRLYASTGVRNMLFGSGKGAYHCASSAFTTLSLGASGKNEMWWALWRGLSTNNRVR